MILKRIEVKAQENGLKTNCYIVADENTKEAMVIDPGGEPEKIIEMLDILGVSVKYICLTHCHGDHIGGLRRVKEAKGGKILISREDSEGLHDENLNLSYYIKIENPNMEADSRLDDGDLIHVGNIEFRVLKTPGHTRGGICILCENEKLLFSGDTIFSGSWGRTDLPTGNFEEIINSIETRIMVLPEDTIIYPGHGKSTMVKEEKVIYFELRKKDF